ncbi:MAG: hypothetical protein HY924_02845 [Elusimicrobia bacterium]|nr:hypothetical protein [Elusimicrobiota bacterium]
MKDNAPGVPRPSPSSPWPGVTEIRPVTSKIYGFRVRRGLVSKLKGVPGLTHANPKSDLFCVELDPMDLSPEGALNCFKKIVSEAGLGPHFGIPAAKRGAAR